MLGRPLNCKDISSEYCQGWKGVRMERLDKYNTEEECWQEILIPDQTCTPAELAASRIDSEMAEDAQAARPQDRHEARQWRDD